MVLNLYYMKSILEFLMKHPEMVMIISLSLYFLSLLPLPAFSLPKSILLRGHSPLITVLVRVLQKKNRTNRISNKGIYHKEFAHMVVEAEKAPRSAVGRPDNQISQWWKFQSECGITRKKKLSKGSGETELSGMTANLSSPTLFCSLQAFTSWTKSSHFGESNLLYALY